MQPKHIEHTSKEEKMGEKETGFELTKKMLKLLLSNSFIALLAVVII